MWDKTDIKNKRTTKEIHGIEDDYLCNTLKKTRLRINLCVPFLTSRKLIFFVVPFGLRLESQWTRTKQTKIK